MGAEAAEVCRSAAADEDGKLGGHGMHGNGGALCGAKLALCFLIQVDNAGFAALLSWYV